MRVRLRIRPNAFGNALGSSLARANSGGGGQQGSDGGDQGGATGSAGFDLKKAKDDLFGRYYPKASLTPEAYAERERLAALGVIPSNEFPQMSQAPGSVDSRLGGVTFRSNIPFDPNPAVVYTAETTYHRPEDTSLSSNTNAAQMGIRPVDVDADIDAGKRDFIDAAWYATRVTGYKAWDFVTAGFVSRHDVRVTANDRGRLSNANFYKATAIDGVGTVGGMIVAGRAGGFVMNRTGGGYIGAAATGATVGATFDLAHQGAQNASYFATNGQSGRAGFSAQEFGDSAAYGAMFGVGGKFLADYGHYNVQFRRFEPGTLYSTPLPFELAAPEAAQQGPLVFRAPAGATPAEIAQLRAYVEGSNAALAAGEPSPSGRVSTKGELRYDASAEAALERRRAELAGAPYTGQAGHVPDTTWTGNAKPHSWLDLTPRVNSSLGAQARGYPIGYRPTTFIFKEPI